MRNSSEKRNNLKKILVMGATAFGAGLFIHYDNKNNNPITLEGRYIRMGETSPAPKDLDKDGLSELTLEFNDKTYVLREINGKPVLSEYKFEGDSLLIR